jgi:hypothetical protein
MTKQKTLLHRSARKTANVRARRRRDERFAALTRPEVAPLPAAQVAGCESALRAWVEGRTPLGQGLKNAYQDFLQRHV